ncbi:MAG: Pyridoxine/pyridoxamine 5-phosphate oxidase [Verrucomicrobiota bacterium]
MDLSEFRKEYAAHGIDRHELRDDPLAQFKAWFDQAKTAGVIEPNAMVLSTFGSTFGLDGFPSSRTVLLKAADERGFSFFTNYDSKKGEEIAANPRVTLLFPWFSLERQIHITGSLIKTSEEESVTYFARRPYGSQLGALASDQSDIIADRGVLEARLADLKAKHPEGQVPRPPHWGGYRLVPISFEFWQGRTNRLHDRFHYTLNKGVWDIVRLSP